LHQQLKSELSKSSQLGLILLQNYLTVLRPLSKIPDGVY